MSKPATRWQRLGVWVAYYDSPGADVDLLAQRCADNHVGWVALKIHDGTRIEPYAAWLTRFRAALERHVEMPGMRPEIIGWGVQQNAPTAEARLVAQLVQADDLKAYIADAEGPYKADYQMADGTMGVKARAGVFTTEYRRHLPTLPSALSSFGASSQKPDGTYWLLGSTTNPRTGPMDYGPWSRAGFRWLPQAYPNEFGDVYSVRNCVNHALAAGWTRGFTHPVIGCYEHDGHRHPIESYLSELHVAGTIGFSVFLAETMTAEEWAYVGAHVSALGPARR